MTNSEQLREIKKKCGLTHQTIAMCTQKHRSTVNRWLVHPKKDSHIDIPDKELEKVQLLADILTGDKKIIFFD